ncbi:MAG TPA: GNAT family N-acetyltransferase [Candidatus Baltobacteraceae bacterium]
MPLEIRRYAPGDQSTVVEFLGRAPYDNVFLTHLVLSDPPSLARGALYVAYDGGAVCGVAFFGRQVVLAANDAAVDAFVPLAAKHRGERMIVGPRPQVARYWAGVKARHRAARIVRERQPVMAVDATTLLAPDDRTVARRARPDETAAVAHSSAEMILGELGYDPRALPADFAGGVSQMIARRMWWVGERDGVLCFFCNIGAWSSQTAQLQSIWTPPSMRGAGLATSALAGVCRQLLKDVPTLSLYVNDFNRAAIRLYERVGFRPVGEFQTLLF